MMDAGGDCKSVVFIYAAGAASSIANFRDGTWQTACTVFPFTHINPRLVAIRSSIPVAGT